MTDKRYIDRNRKLRHLFIRVYNTNTKKFVRLVGGMNRPRVLVGEEFIAEGFLSNESDTFNITNSDKAVVYKVELLDNADDYDEEMINTIRENVYLNIIFKIRFRDSILFLSGYKYFNSDKTIKNGYPIFSKYNPKIFYDQDYAENAAKNLRKYGYIVEVE